MATQRRNKQGEKETRGSSKDTAPPETMAQSQPFERQIVITNAIKTTIGLAVTSGALYYYVPIPVPSLPTITHRFLYTLRLQTPAFLILMASILDVSIIRLYTPAINPLSGNAEHHVLFANCFLTNHVQQMLLNVPGQLVLASFLDEGQMKVIPILVALFVFGRASFYMGYKRSYLKRTVGFMSSMVPSCIIWIVNAYFLGKVLFQNETIKV